MSQPKNKGRIIFALDMSMNASGWAVVKIDNGSIKLLATGEIKPNPKKPHGERLVLIRERLNEVYKEYKPTDVVKEAGFARFIKATQVLYKAYGVTEELFAGLGHGQIPEYSAGTIKKVVGGHGKAKKEEVEAGVRKFVELPKGYTFPSDNVSDAVAVAITHAKKKKYIK